MSKLKVGLLGATGMAGQRYIQLLENHPLFEVTFVAASGRSEGKKYSEAVLGRWYMTTPIPASVAALKVANVSDLERAVNECDFVFSAVDSSTAKEFEFAYAARDIPVISNAGANRWVDDVPVIMPEINYGHSALIDSQRKARGFKKGFVVTKPNCSLQSYLMALAPLKEKFGMTRVVITTLQALSGAGYPGVPSLAIVDNVLPLIQGEEEKSEREPGKILGKIMDGKVVADTSFAISAHCNRVATLDGHLACVSVEFGIKPARDEILKIWSEFRSYPQQKFLPMAPEQPIMYIDEPDRPQVNRDRDAGRGMAVTVGRLRDCPVFHYRFACLSHNTIRGAAGGGILIAEMLKEQGYL
jgi:aspartate-semialdehyde dehydrogenase